jgi:hypothetical protein
MDRQLLPIVRISKTFTSFIQVADMYRTFVMPAEAGIQSSGDRQEISLIDPTGPWMPASAGMTFICDDIW